MSHERVNLKLCTDGLRRDIKAIEKAESAESDAEALHRYLSRSAA